MSWSFRGGVGKRWYVVGLALLAGHVLAFSAEKSYTGQSASCGSAIRPEGVGAGAYPCSAFGTVQTSQPAPGPSALKPASKGGDVQSESQASRFDNVISALMGAVLTFLATQYNERKNWIRKKSEQLRDKQFGKLSEAARALDAATGVVSKCSARLDSLVRRVGAGGGTVGVVEAELQALGRQAVKDISGAQSSLKLATLDLRICRVTGVTMNSLVDAHRHLVAVQTYFDALTGGNGIGNQSVVSNSATELARLSERFAATALDSLTE